MEQHTRSPAAMEVEVLMLVCTATWIEPWSPSPWVAAAPGAGNKVKKTKSSARHGILLPVNLSNHFENPSVQAVLRSKAALIKDTVMMYRSSQQKDRGGGGGRGGMFERWYAGLVGVMHVLVIV